MSQWLVWFFFYSFLGYGLEKLHGEVKIASYLIDEGGSSKRPQLFAICQHCRYIKGQQIAIATNGPPIFILFCISIFTTERILVKRELGF